MSDTTHRALRLALASLLVVALVSQLAIGMSRSALTVANFLSFFTVLSNISAVVLLAVLAARPGRDASMPFAVFRGAVTVYMSVAALVYAISLAPIAADVGVAEPWIDWSIHVIGPVALAVDWILDPPPAPLPTRSLWIWLVFPTAYLGYSLVRGAIMDWYPHPFLDPSGGGYPAVALWSAVVLVVILGLGFAYHWWSSRHHATPAST